VAYLTETLPHVARFNKILQKFCIRFFVMKAQSEFCEVKKMFTYNVHIPIIQRVMLVSWHKSAKIYNFETPSPGTDLNRRRPKKQEVLLTSPYTPAIKVNRNSIH
jgi:hypothetical protein